MWTDRNDRSPFENWFKKLPENIQILVDAAITEILEPLGNSICETEWGKPLGDGLYEFRIRRSLNEILNLGRSPEGRIEVKGGDVSVLLRIFCTFYGDRVVLLFQGYDKKKDPSERRQQREIRKARKNLKDWKRRG